MQESVNTYQHDVTNLDSVFSQLQASLNERYNWLRRTLDLNHQESQTILAERMNLAATLGPNRPKLGYGTSRIHRLATECDSKKPMLFRILLL